VITVHDEPGATLLKFSGPATLYESQDMRNGFRSALSQGQDLRIDLENSGPWDLAGLQVLISTVTTAHKSGMSVRLVQVPGVCRELSERSGLLDWLTTVTESFH
jgi:ABC-type transporter Mla MlaB component